MIDRNRVNQFPMYLLILKWANLFVHRDDRSPRWWSIQNVYHYTNLIRKLPHEHFPFLPILHSLSFYRGCCFGAEPVRHIGPTGSNHADSSKRGYKRPHPHWYVDYRPSTQKCLRGDRLQVVFLTSLDWVTECIAINGRFCTLSHTHVCHSNSVFYTDKLVGN